MEQTESHTAVVETDTDFACFVKAKDKGEKTFTIRAQDSSAPEVIEFWAYLNEPALGSGHPKIVGARAMAEQMRAWPGRRQAD